MGLVVVAMITSSAYSSVFTSEPRMCCMALTASCMACAAGMTVEEYCQNGNNAIGCRNVSPFAQTLLDLALRPSNALKRRSYSPNKSYLRTPGTTTRRSVIQDLLEDLMARSTNPRRVNIKRSENNNPMEDIEFVDHTQMKCYQYFQHFQ